MKIERGKNASRNIIFGTLLKGYGILLPFIMRSVIVYELGVNYLGLNSLFNSILHVLNLAELGVGSAMVFSMYKPIAEDDSDMICAYMYLYRQYYRIIGAVVLVLGTIITPFIPRLIRSDVPEDINVYILYLLNLLATVLTYWLFAHRKSVLEAHQRNDLISKVTIATDTAKYLLQILALVLFQNYYYFVIAILISQVLNNIVSALISKRMFPEYDPKGTIPAEEKAAMNRRIRDFFTAKFGGTVVSWADAIVISAFLGLEALAIYQNYYYVVNAIIGVVAIIYASIVAGVGNSILVKSNDENKKDFHVFTFMIAWLSAICISCFASMYQPFMRLWMGEKLLLSNDMVVLFCVYFWVFEIDKMITVYKDAGGIWHQDRFRPLITGIVNLVLNIIMVNFIGLYGVLLSTIISFALISDPWIISNVFKLIFKDSPRQYVMELAAYTIGIFAIAMVCNFLSYRLIPDTGIATFILKGFISFAVSNTLFILVFNRSPHYQRAKRLLLRMLGRRY